MQQSYRYHHEYAHYRISLEKASGKIIDMLNSDSKRKYSDDEWDYDPQGLWNEIKKSAIPNRTLVNSGLSQITPAPCHPQQQPPQQRLLRYMTDNQREVISNRSCQPRTRLRDFSGARLSATVGGDTHVTTRPEREG